MYNLRRRLDDSLASVTVAGIAFQQACVEAPFRLACPADMFEHVQKQMSESREISTRYAMAHPWKVLFSTALVDPEFWASWNAARMVQVSL